MKTPKTYIIKTVRICLILCVLFFYNNLQAKGFRFQEKQQQDTLINPKISFLWGKSNALNNTKQYDELLIFLEKHLKNVQPKTEKDSLDVADLYYNQFEGNYYTGKYLESINSANKGMPFCGKAISPRAKHIKGVLYYKRAYGESGMNFAKRAKVSMKTALEYLSDDYQANLDYLVDAHVFLSSQAAYYGNIEDAKLYIRLAEKAYQNNRKYLDKFRKDRYEVVLLYRKAYLLYKLAESKKDSLELVDVVQKLEKLHDLPTFDTSERIYYSTTMNHVGDWYVSHKHDSLTTKQDLEVGSYYVDKSIDLIENKNYPGNYFTFKYNKCKALTLANELQKADVLITHLLDSMQTNDYRIPFFLAQKGLIKAKLKQKDSALGIFHAVIEKIHLDTTQLTKDYSNFKPSKVFGETRLIRRVAEKLEEFYPNDPTVQQTISKLYALAFIQFENSYARTKFNPQQNNLLRHIICGLLKTRNENSTISIATLLSRSETMMNQMSWQRFYQNRYTNKLPELDSLNYRHLKLRTLLTAAKRDNNIREEDSILNLINQNNAFTNKKFPNLELLSTKKFEIAELQKNLRSDELVLKYMIFEKEIAVFTITSNNIDWQLFPWTNKEIELNTQLLASIKDRSYDANSVSQLSQILLPKIDSNIKKIIINPDGELYRIPFEILQSNNEFLTESHNIRYTSNLKFIYLEDHQSSHDKALAIYAPNYTESQKNGLAVVTRDKASKLAGAKKEAEIIGNLFTSVVYTGEELSKEKFISTAPTAGILHLAMHAQINDKEPGLSRLLFSKNNAGKDDLYLEELYALQLKADLAVLSACNTGVGKENAGRNVESFQRAFTFAGVPATVVSLWEVPDQSTSEIMGSFYQNLKDGYPKSEALKKAKLSYLNVHKGTKLEQPFYWTGFVLYGEENAISPSSSNIIWYLLGMSFLIILGIAFYRKKTR
ncbi:CHAT domain-containing protein [Kordia sp.]|uniref:CHAT domain-containing protein n=1 Tax=Kordia sp. TaxID=1965332 RepID=UPI003B5B75B4